MQIMVLASSRRLLLLDRWVDKEDGAGDGTGRSVAPDLMRLGTKE